MGDFRKVVFALAVLLALAGMAAAQPTFQCNVTASVPPTVRTEGFTEQTGDVVLTCAGGTAPTLPPVGTTAAITSFANITVFLQAPVTSRLLSTTLNASEVLLMIDEPATQVACTSPSAGGSQSVANGGCNSTLSATGAISPNVYQGVISGQSVTFFGVPIVPPASTSPRVYRVSNIRVSATGAGGSGGFPGQIGASVSINGAQGVPLNNPNQIVAYGQSGLTTALRNASNGGSLTTPINLAQCVAQGADSTSAGNRPPVGYMRFTENFGSAFKTRSITQGVAGAGNNAPAGMNIPGQVNSNSESGFFFPSYSSGQFVAGLADHGTRLKAVFNNVPAGARIYVSFNNTNVAANVLPTANSYAQIVATTLGGELTMDYSGLPPVTPVSGDTIGTGVATVELPVVNGSASAVWEVVNSLPFQLENLDFAFAIRYTASTATNSPAPGTGTLNLSFAPTAGLSATSAASTNANIPRFADTSTATRLYTISPCRTVLLFPWVVNVQGLDTGIAIVNTSTDPFGTTPQAGTCTLNAYGTNAPTQPINTQSVASGSYTALLASAQLPGFIGYVIATCNFQFAHGFAYISDVGTRNLAMGYLALIIPDPGTGGTGRNPTGFTATATNEILGQ